MKACIESVILFPKALCTCSFDTSVLPLSVVSLFLVSWHQPCLCLPVVCPGRSWRQTLGWRCAGTAGMRLTFLCLQTTSITRAVFAVTGMETPTTNLVMWVEHFVTNKSYLVMLAYEVVPWLLWYFWIVNNRVKLLAIIAAVMYMRSEPGINAQFECHVCTHHFLWWL